MPALEPFPPMRATKRAEHAFKEAGKKTEGALKEVGDSVKEVFRGVEESFSSMKLMPTWWASGGSKKPADRPEDSPADRPVERPQTENDAAMRRHCAALERLVEMGLSPQAARVALRQLDAWLVSADGVAEMAAAEAAACNAGEPILHVGDVVRLEGLVKNPAANGKTGTLQAYGAENLRWKVVLADGQVYWIKPRLLRPLEIRRLPWQQAISQGSAAEQRQASHADASLRDSWAKLEAREIELLEKEESLRKVQEALEAHHNHLQSQGLRSGVGSLGLEKCTAVPEDSVQDASLDDDDDEEEVEADEMWDMDWTRLAGRHPIVEHEVSTAP